MKHLKFGMTAAALISAMALGGCGKQEYRKAEFAATSQEAGARQLPAKVDIVIVPDNSGSMNAALATVESQMAGFVSSLRSKYWDFRIAKTAIINPSPIQKVLVNPDFNGATLPDGTPNPNAATVVPSANALTDAGSFLPLVTSLDATGAPDLAYQNTEANVRAVTFTSDGGTGWPTKDYSVLGVNPTLPAVSPPLLRKDALLAVIVLTNGAEYSVDPNHNGYLSTTQLSTWAAKFKALRVSPSLVRFYPIAANSAYAAGGCLGGPAYIGTSYTRMVTDGYLPGKAFNICDFSALSNVLTSIENDLTITRESYVRSYIVIPHEPIVSSIRVYKNGVQLSQGETNGWVYEGGPKTVSTVSGILSSNGQIIPFTADQQTGYVIRLNGSARLIGNDVPDVQYQRP
ncbi:MAG: hypothetical protein HYW49_09865 [Deltaproteobacteria bacterium]|nr:hypothetical protein [Deltaproteobacteria bacterium]